MCIPVLRSCTYYLLKSKPCIFAYIVTYRSVSLVLFNVSYCFFLQSYDKVIKLKECFWVMTWNLYNVAFFDWVPKHDWNITQPFRRYPPIFMCMCLIYKFNVHLMIISYFQNQKILVFCWLLVCSLKVHVDIRGLWGSVSVMLWASF